MGVIPTLSEEGEPEPTLEEQVQSRLQLDGYFDLVEVVSHMRRDLQEAILNEEVPFPWYEQMKGRVRELRRGHLARGEDDSSPGAIHWFEGT